MSEVYRSLFSVIPARVRDDHTLRPNAKLLYGELSALAQAEGYCWAFNSYLAEQLGVASKTVEGLLKQLRDRGHIQLEVERDPETNEVLRRKIWICGPPGSSVPPPLKNEGRSPQNQGDPPLKIEGENNININNTSKDIPQSPPEGGTTEVKKSSRRAPKDKPDWKPERFARFWESYPVRKDRQKAIRAWDKLHLELHLDDSQLDVIARALQRQISSPEWQRKIREEDGQGIPYPASWLNGRRWEDEVRPGQAASPPGGTQGGGLDYGFR